MNRLNRHDLANVYLKGAGIEIGALHNPLKVPKVAKVKYVDRMTKADLRKHYSELANLNLVDVDIIDNGENLSTIANDSQDFVIANHFLEHCQNPIHTLMNMLRVLKKGGILYLSLPDKRYTFDIDRPITPLQHIVDDYEKGAEHSKYQHFEEWVRFIDKVKEPEIKKATQALIEKDYSIHFHVWTQNEIMEIILFLKRFGQDVDVEACLKNGLEFITILRKNS